MATMCYYCYRDHNYYHGYYCYHVLPCVTMVTINVTMVTIHVTMATIVTMVNMC